MLTVLRKSRLHALRWLASQPGGESIYVRGMARLLGWLYRNGLIEYPAAYTARITAKGREALAAAQQDSARHRGETAV